MQRSNDIVHFRLSQSLKAALKAYAAEEDMTDAGAARDLLREALRSRGKWPISATTVQSA
jgi:hypothetical protein